MEEREDFKKLEYTWDNVYCIIEDAIVKIEGLGI